VGGRLIPDPNEEALLYQTLLGAWPLDEAELDGFRDRLKAFVVKAAREAKTNTSWLEPDPAHEEALTAFLDAILDPSPDNRFLSDFQRLQQRVAFPGGLNSLSQALLKATAPGIPDIYQGTEMWDFSLV